MARPMHAALFPPSAFRDLVVRAGGPAAMARRLARATNTIRTWLAAGGVPDTLVAVRLAREEGLAVESLAPTEAEPTDSHALEHKATPQCD